MTRYNIGKLYLHTIQLADPGFSQSILIYLGVFVIHLQVPLLAPALFKSNHKPESGSQSSFEYPG